MRQNDRTNRLIMWLVVAADFVLLNALLYAFSRIDPTLKSFDWRQLRMFVVIANISLLLSELKFHPIVHKQIVSAGEVLRKVVVLTLSYSLIAYITMRHLMYWTASGFLLLKISSLLFVLLVLTRFLERTIIKKLRRMGRNARSVTLVGSDKELWNICKRLLDDPTTGYHVQGYYADEKVADSPIPYFGKVADLLDSSKHPEGISIGDEMYVCLSRKEKNTIKALSNLCDKHVTKFYYVPVSVESIGLNLQREYINDIEIYTTHETPLDNLVSLMIKRIFDIVVSLIALLFTILIFPFIWLIIKIQSPGPIFFKQVRTGLDGKNFVCYKFRSMHVNKDADTLQATKDDPRKYPFGNFMRKANIDELPQFWNVLKGNMSIVGPRPHMLAHTDIYSKLIKEYMVRHFIKPGITGWAQVMGFRGETKELWQMEERVKRDIWYMEHWSIWLDIRIVWLTFKTFFVHDKNAY